jgi:GxxExxY protein
MDKPQRHEETEGLETTKIRSRFERTHDELESVYERCLCHELRERDIAIRTQVSFPMIYRGIRIDAGVRIDLIAGERVVVELKAVEAMHPLYAAQLLTYLKLTGLRLGLLINFNVPLIRDGIKRIAL